MSLIKYRAFVHVVEQGSLTRAAAIMGYSQPGISKMIETLEDELNTSLFIRNSSSLELTENGKQIYVYCKDIVKRENEMMNAINAMNGLLTGNIRIGAQNSIIMNFVPSVIKAYTNAHPFIQMHLDEMCNYDIVDKLKDDTIDIGFTSQFDTRGITFIPLFQDPVRLIVNKNHPYASYEKIPVSALNNCDFIMLPPEGNDLILTVKRTQPFTPIAKFYVHSDAAAVSMVSADLGVYIISEMQCQNLPDTILKKEFEEPIYRNMGIGIKSQKYVTPALEEMIRISKLQIDAK